MKFVHQDAKISKLATREDPYHIHKTLGFLSLCSFTYRYAYVYNTTGSLGFKSFDGSRDNSFYFDFATMLIHTLLAFSSVLFRVPRKRIVDKPMIIYEEYRQHAMVFTSRCFFVFCVAYLYPATTWPSYLAALVVLIHHLIADRVTMFHGSPGNTAVRATSARLELSDFYKFVAKGYSLYQFLAIASHITASPAHLADMAYNSIIAIQSSAFLMTLYRKRIITGKSHMAGYAFCVALSAFHIVRCIGLFTTLLTIGAFTLRTILPREVNNKYLIWTLFLILVSYDYGQIQWDYFSDSLVKLFLERSTLQGSSAALCLYAVFSAEYYFHSKNTTSSNLVEKSTEEEDEDEIKSSKVE